MARWTRRRFLKTAAVAAGMAHLPRTSQGEAMPECRIAKVETFPMTYPTAGRFRFFEGPGGVRLGRQGVVVKITSEDGTVGWGQSVPTHKWSYETLETVHTTIERYLSPVILGLNAFDTAAIEHMMNTYIAPSFSTGQPICKAGIDLALFDLTGKVLGQTAAQRWRRNGRRRITLSWTLNPTTLDDVEPLIEQGWQRGYRNFNVKVAPDPEFDVAMCRIVRRRVPDGFLWADANGGFDEATALAIAPRLADAGVDVFEQPVPPNCLTAHQKLKKQGALPIILDEGVVSSVELAEFIALGMCDGVAMKPARCGGLIEARRQIEMIEKHGLMFLGSGLTDPDLSLAASLLLYGAYDLATPAALNAPQFLTGTILANPFVVQDGQLEVPTGVGLGVEVDPTKLDAMRI
jgi:L-alanine-DL-glutamate epimerase-like enolase superfamily enzyme